MKLTIQDFALSAALALAACGSGGGGSATTETPQPLTPPSDLAYGADVAYYIQGVLIPANTPEWEGTVESFSVNPALPTGLSLDSETGSVTGIPMSESEARTYTILGEGLGDTVQAELRLAVVNKPRLAVVASKTDSTLSVHTVDPLTGNLSLHAIQSTPVGQEGPEEVVLHPNGRFLYVPTTSNLLSIYRVEENSGRLVAQTPVALDQGPHQAALSADGQTLYLSSELGNSLRGFKIDSNTGALTEGPSTTPAPSAPGAVTVDPLGRFVYVVQKGDESIRTYSINSDSGQLNHEGDDTSFVGQNPVRVGTAPDGSWAFVITGNKKVNPAAVHPTTGFLQPNPGSGLDTGEAPEAVAVHPTGRFIYVTASGEDEVGLYNFDYTAGEMIASTSLEVESMPRHITFDASGLYAYVCHQGTNEVTAYDVDLATGELMNPRGTLTQYGPSAVTLITGAETVLKRPEHMYVLGSQANELVAYDMDPDTGELTEIGTAPVGDLPRDMRLDPLGRFAFVANTQGHSISVLSIDADGGLSNLWEIDIDEAPRGLGIDPHGRILYVSARTSNKVISYTIDEATGFLTKLDEAPTQEQPRSLSLHPTGRFLYVANFDSGTASAYSVKDGIFIQGPINSPAPSQPDRIRFSPRGDRAFLGGNGSDILIPYNIDRATGELLPILPGRGVGNRPLAVDVHQNDLWAYAAISDLPDGTGWVRFTLMDREEGDFQNGDIGAVIEAGLNPGNLRVAPGGEFLAVLNRGSHDISVFAIDQTSGMAINQVITPTALEPYAIEFSYTLE
ncbi:MAG: 6-phosphogluconolactonase [Planctomycetota bacterium]|jgi:6-phosphogluconolactonase